VNAVWAFVEWLAAEPSRPLGLFCLVCVVGVFGGYFTRRRRR
jgi:hypothetical protein